MRQFLSFLFAGILSMMLFHQTKAQVRPAIQWQKCLGGTGDDRGHDVLINADGTLIVVGQTYSNNGDVSGNHGNGDAWVVKLDTAGNIIWQRSLGGSGSDYFKSVIATTDNAYLCIGYTTSNDGNVSGNHGSGDAFIMKLDENGNTIWSKCFGGSLGDTAVKAIVTPDNNYAVIGSSASTDGDLTTGGNGGWVFKINNAGNLLWSGGLYSAGGLSGFDIAISEDQNIYALTSGLYQYIAGLWPNEVTINKTPGKIFKLNNITGANIGLFATIGGDSCFAMLKTSDKLVTSLVDEAYFYPEYCFDETLYLKTKPDLSPTFTTTQVGSAFTRNCYSSGATAIPIYIASSHGLAVAETGSGLILAGTSYFNNPAPTPYGWISDVNNIDYRYGYGFGSAAFRSVKVYPNGNEYIVVGYAYGNGDDISGYHGGLWDCWVVKLSGLNRIVGNIFLDANNNNIKDQGETAYTHAYVKTTGSSYQRTVMAYNGFFENVVATGNFTSTISLNRPYYTVVPTSKNTTFNTYRNIDSVNFAVHPIPGIIDYAVGVSPLTIPRPGTVQQYTIRYNNKGTTTLTNKDVVFIKAPSLHFVSSTPAYTAVSGDSIKWNISSLAPDATGTINLSLILDGIPTVNLGDTIESALYIDSTQDIYRADNYIAIRQVLSGSYDPNDKQEIHGGFITPAEIAAGKWLDYTIRFQNTGNDTAFNIIIRDTLSSKLLADSIEVIGSSHNCSFTVKSGQFITCTFNNINLVDSTHNEPLSHGYISYRIKPKSTLVLGDSIRNSASIYFDFNPPVRTNTQITVVSNRPLPVIWTGAVSTAWEDPLNWNSGAVPDGNSNVTINSGVPRYPVVNSNAICRSLKIQPGATFLVKTGFNLKVLH